MLGWMHMRSLQHAWESVYLRRGVNMPCLSALLISSMLICLGEVVMIFAEAVGHRSVGCS
jgi:hypothetical protein